MLPLTARGEQGSASNAAVWPREREGANEGREGHMGSETESSVADGLAPDPQESRAPAGTGRDARCLETGPPGLQPWALRLSGPSRHGRRGRGDSRGVGPGPSWPETRLNHTKTKAS